MTQAQRSRQAFRNQIDSIACVYPASVFDPLSARIAEDLGFEVGMFAGSTASLSVLGAPDLIVLTLDELAQQARRICRASQLPILVDADHGYGNHLNVRRTVAELENAGIAALTIEDTQLPTPFGASGKAALISIEEGAGKMRAAVDARDDSTLVIVARTSAPQITDMKDTIARLVAYEKTGVDALFIVGVKNWAQLQEIRSSTNLPLMLGSAGAELMDRKQLASFGVRICLQGHQTMAATVHALQSTMKALRDGADPSSLPNIASPETMQQVSRSSQYSEWNHEFGGANKKD